MDPSGGNGLVNNVISLTKAHEDAKFLAFASLALIFYDWILTIDEEVTHIWKPPYITLTKALFILNRWLVPPSYIFHIFTLFADPSGPLCRATLMRPIFLMVHIVIIQLVLVLRVYALFEKKRWMLVVLVIVVCASVTTSLVNVITISKTRVILGSAFLDGCAVSIPNGAFVPFLTGLILHTILYAMTVYKTYTLRKQLNSPLIACLFRDGTVVYLFLICALTPTLVFMLVPYPFLAFPCLTSNYFLAMGCIGASRLVLSLHARLEDYETPESSAHNRRLDFESRDSYELATAGVSMALTRHTELTTRDSQDPSVMWNDATERGRRSSID